ncbi:hypothetical protein PHMEG_00025398 [Phytophthora megakarya]|uniref:CCHC-type domain-containing protein n=1 Tax=Phytophthora megakarya TaxID=4795 RepID=A0A225VC44_9STRA|nr:hypothetical protein PHMEG_00025398 [Phytophthora megakarya]
MQHIEKGLAQTNMQVIFSMDEVQVEGENLYWRMPDFEKGFETGILETSRENGVEFDSDELRAVVAKSAFMVGRPSTKTRALWDMMKPGYLMIRGVRIWMQPAFTGRSYSNSSLVEIYQGEKVCFQCHKPGYFKAACPTLQSKYDARMSNQPGPQTNMVSTT